MNELREEIELRTVCPRCKGIGSTESIGFSSAGDMDAGNEPHQVVQSCYICKDSGKVCLPIEELEIRLKSSLAANRELHEKVANAQAFEILAQAKCNELEAANREQKAQLLDRDNHIDLAYKALGDVNRSVYLFDHIREQKAEIERLKGCLKQSNAGMEEYERKYYLELNLAEQLESESSSLRASAGEKWIDVKQELPPIDTRVLMLYAYPTGSEIEIGNWSCDHPDCPELRGTWWGDQHILGANDISHWMPLPVAPPTLPTEKEK